MQTKNNEPDSVHSAHSERLLTVTEVAEYLAISQSSVRQLAVGRKLAFIRIGRQLRFRQDDLAALEEKLRTKTLDEMLTADFRRYGRPQTS